jgi:transketolase
MKKKEREHLQKINILLRYLILNMTTVAGSGHPTSSLSAVEMMSALLFGRVFRYDVSNPRNACNDRLIFSKGHASPLYYALWAVAGAISLQELEKYRTFDSFLEGHPTPRFPFTEAATGSLGQGLSVGVGIALAQKKLDKTNARTYVLMGDSEMAEGQVWEAMQIASHYELDNLVALVDVNRLGQRGETILGHDVETYAQRAKAFGWRSIVVDGHNADEIMRVYRDVIGTNRKPLMIIAKTFKGKGISFLEDKYNWHGKVLSKDEFTDAIEQLGEIDFAVRGEITRPNDCGKENVDIVHEEKNLKIDHNERYATRDGYGIGLVDIMQKKSQVVALDAETSNSTRADHAKDHFPKRFFEMFIAEQNMVSVAVGLSRMGYMPFVSSFAAFLTRAHDQIRMASLSNVQITFVGSHAGVSIGADGGSQMGLDDIAMFRSILGSVVFYPCDIVSMQKVLQISQKRSGITYVRATREKTSIIYDDQEKLTIGGSHVVFEDPRSDIAIIAAGITVHESLKAAKNLKNHHVPVRVIDLYGIKPIDLPALEKSVGNVKKIIIVEDHFFEGGVGEAVKSVWQKKDVRIEHLAVNKIPRSGTSEELLAYEEIDFNAIIKKVLYIHKT